MDGTIYICIELIEASYVNAYIEVASLQWAAAGNGDGSGGGEGGTTNEVIQSMSLESCKF